MPTPRGVPLSIGPCVVTADELDPQTAFVTVRIDGEEWVKGNLNGTALGLLRDEAARRRMAVAGRRWATANFDRDEIVESYRALYRATLGLAGSRRELAARSRS